MKWLTSISLIICLFLSRAEGQEVTVTAAFDTSRIYVGDQINFTITIDKPVSYLLSLPAFKDTLNKHIEIIKGPVLDTSLLKDGRQRIREKYLVTSFDSGTYQILTVFAEMRNEGGLKRFYSNESRLEVIRVKIAPADTTMKIFDIIKPYRAPLTAGEVLPWILLAIIITAGIWYLVRFIKNIRMKKAGQEPVNTPDPAHLIAFRELEKLKGEKLWQKGEVKGYYTRLTEILRQYLENRYRIYSLEMTTLETLTELTRTGFKDDVSYRKIRTVLSGADLVKFAKYNPEPSENDLHFEYAWDFVNATMMKEQMQEKDINKDQNKEDAV
jgi:hypothetical protein